MIEFTLIDVAVVGGELLILAIAHLSLIWSLTPLRRRLIELPGVRSHPGGLATVQQKLSQILLFLWLGCSLLTVAANLVMLYRGYSLWPVTQTFFQRLPPETWIELGNATLLSGAILATTAIVQRLLSRGLDRLNQFAQNWDQFIANDASINIWFQAVKRLAKDGIWLMALYGCSRRFSLRIVSASLLTILTIYLIVAIALVLRKGLDVIIDSLDAWTKAYISQNAALQTYKRLRNLVPFLKRCCEYAIYIGAATLVVNQIDAISQWATIGAKAIKILGIVLVSRIVTEIIVVFVAEYLLNIEDLSDDEHKRRMTLVPILQSAARYGAYFWAAIFILQVIEIDPAPILATAGIVGLAIGLGAQNLINDTVSGFFILLENYYLVGDYIVVAESEGVVESIELRTTRIRHPNGQLQILRNGDITSIINYSRDYIYAVVDIGVAYTADLNHVYQVIEAIGLDLMHRFPADVLEPTAVDGVEAFQPSKIIVRTVTKLKPNNSRRGVHDDIQGDLRKILKEAFDREGIVMPVAQIVGVPMPPSEE
ncbi:MAG: mechanosensitive ion channel family protein [Leptolyngbyaceae bacterium]|nr:mechanosensitive ion channel family protein [Leptolyngbyaceae bacterium]